MKEFCLSFANEIEYRRDRALGAKETFRYVVWEGTFSLVLI